MSAVALQITTRTRAAARIYSAFFKVGHLGLRDGKKRTQLNNHLFV
jgi:hypothetical protein